MDEQLAPVARRRARVALTLTLVMVVAYFGFIALVGFAPSTAGSLLGGRVSVGIVLGAAVIALAPVLVLGYARWAHRHDAAVAALRARR